MSDTSLVFNVLARDKASRVFSKIRRSAQEGGSAIRMAFGPAIAPVMATATTAAIGLGAALAGAGAAAGVFGAVAGSAFGEVKEAADKTDQLREKIRLLDQQAAMTTGDQRTAFLEKSAKATLELQARLKLLDPATRKAAVGFMQMKSDWLDFVDANKPATFNIMSKGFQAIGLILPKLQPLFNVGAQAADRFAGALLRAAKGGGVDRLVSFLATQAGPALNNLGVIGKNFAVVIGNVGSSFAGTGQGILQWLADASSRWAEWSKQTEGGGLSSFIAYVQTNGPKVWSLLSDIATAGVNIARAVAPLAPISLAIAGGLAAVISALPPGVITTLVAAWVAYSVALKAYHAYMLIVGVATKVWTGIQWALNVAMSANPIGLVVLAIVALIAIIVLIATKTTWFQQLWGWIWSKIGDPVKAIWAWIKNNWPLLIAIMTGPVGWIAALIIKNWDTIKSATTAVKNWIVNAWNTVVGFIRSMPGKITSAARNMFNGIKNAFKSAVNWIIGRWNGLSFTIGGGSIMGIGIPSVTLGTPDIPYLYGGGTIRRGGAAVVADQRGRGGEMVHLPKGAQVTPLRGGAGGGVVRIELVGKPGADRWIIEMLRKFVTFKGGNVQVAFGSGS